MAAPYTTTTDYSHLVTTAYDKVIIDYLRSQPQFRSIVDVKPQVVTHTGSPVRIFKNTAMGTSTTPLNETTDPSGQALSNPTYVDVTPAEYGDYTVHSKKLQTFELTGRVDANTAMLIADAMNDSVDALVAAKLDAGTRTVTEQNGTLKKIGETQAVNSILATDVLKAKHVHYAVAKARGESVGTVKGSSYGVFIHPDVAHDLRADTSAGAWLTPSNYSQPGNVWAAEIGEFGGAFFMESPRCSVVANTAGTPVDIYNTYVFGRQALAEVVPEEFHMVINGDISDPLDRKLALGWYGIGGWELFETKALTVVKTASSIA